MIPRLQLTEPDAPTKRRRRDTTRRQRALAFERRRCQRDQFATMSSAAAVLAEDVSSPVNSIYLHVQMLQRSLIGTSTDPGLQRRLEAICDDIQRLNGLLDQYRTLHQRGRLSVSAVDLERLLDHTIEAQARICPSSIRIQRQRSRCLPSIRANADALEQAVVTLLDNAVEAMPSGGTLSIRTGHHAGSVSIEISDSGGHARGRLDRVGVGLPLVRQIVTAHGGTIGYACDPEAGTTFTVVLPVDGPSRV